MTEIEKAAARLRTARIAAGYKTAKSFYEKHNISQSTYALHETGRRSILPKVAERYANLLGVSTAWLLTGYGTPYENSDVTNNPSDEQLSRSEFMELMKFQGNPDLKKCSTYENEMLNSVDPMLFCKIVIKMIDALKEIKFELDHDNFTKKAVEIYKDISDSAENQESQFTMIDLSMTIFKRHIKEVMEIRNNDLARKA